MSGFEDEVGVDGERAEVDRITKPVSAARLRACADSCPNHWEHSAWVELLAVSLLS